MSLLGRKEEEERNGTSRESMGWMEPEKERLSSLPCVRESGDYEEGDDYEVDLDTCTSSAEILDWIMQIAGKIWADDACLSGLVRALNGILDLQCTVCPHGQDKRLTVTEIRQRVRKVLSAHSYPLSASD
jgi:hypothetical protein